MHTLKPKEEEQQQQGVQSSETREQQSSYLQWQTVLFGPDLKELTSIPLTDSPLIYIYLLGFNLKEMFTLTSVSSLNGFILH